MNGLRARTVDLLQRAVDLTVEARWKVRDRLGSSAPPSTALPLAATRLIWPRSYEWEFAGKWVNGLRLALSRRVPVELGDVPQRFERVVQFELEHRGQRYPLAIDYADKSGIHPACADDALVYFKMQFRRGGYGRPNVVPGGYVTGNQDVYRYLAPVRALRDRRRFVYDVNGRFGLRFAQDIRTRAVQLLGASPLRFQGGTHLVRYSRHLREIAQSKVCVDLPGNGDFCFRLVDYLAVGACVVAVKHGNQLARDLTDGENVVWIREDLSDLVETCAELSRDDDRREQIALNARRYFDANLHRGSLADYYLDRSFAALRREDVAAPLIADPPVVAGGLLI